MSTSTPDSASATESHAVFQHPLAYLLGIEGIALLRAWAGDYDKEFVEARLDDVRRLLDNESLAKHEGVFVNRCDTLTAYRQWAPTYDEPRNGLFDVDEPIVHEILDAQSVGLALDAACGTGRFAAYLAERRHQVIGVDSSPDMLDRARQRVPEGEFLLGELQQLPLPDDAVDLIVSGLALSHVPALGPVMAEFARVLRPGGSLVISDTHPGLIIRGSVVKALGPAGEPGLVRTYRHSAGDFLRAALPVGLQVKRCEEPQSGSGNQSPPPAPEITVGDWQDWPWTLMKLIPAACWAAAAPSTIIWHFQLDAQSC